jgi:hypothetical protein
MTVWPEFIIKIHIPSKYRKADIKSMLITTSVYSNQFEQDVWHNLLLYNICPQLSGEGKCKG